jgi:hypothetical protein
MSLRGAKRLNPEMSGRLGWVEQEVSGALGPCLLEALDHLAALDAMELGSTGRSHDAAEHHHHPHEDG